MGIFDFLGGQNPLASLFGTPAMAGEVPRPPQPPGQVNGLDRLSEAFGGFIYGGSPVGGVMNALKTLSTGQPTNPETIATNRVLDLYRTLQKDFGLTEPQARIVANNPVIMKELSKAMVSPPITVGPSGDIVQQGAFGTLTPRGAFPVSDPTEVVNPDGSKSRAYGIRPSLARPGGGLVVPGQGQSAPRQPNVQGAVAPNDPTMAVSPRQVVANNPVISEQSPQAIAEGKKTGDILGDQFKSYLDLGTTSTKRLGTLSRMAQLNEKAFEGAAAPGVQMLRSALVTFGFPAGKVPAGEEFTALSNKLVMDAQGGSLGSGVSNADVQFIANMSPNLSQTGAGRKEIIITTMAIDRRNQEVAKMATQWRSSHGSIAGFDSFIADWANKNPLFAGRENAQANQPSGFNDRFNASYGGGVATPGGAGYKILKVH